jgi:hypothetical protein
MKSNSIIKVDSARALENLGIQEDSCRTIPLEIKTAFEIEQELKQ